MKRREFLTTCAVAAISPRIIRFQDYVEPDISDERIQNFLSIAPGGWRLYGTRQVATTPMDEWKFVATRPSSQRDALKLMPLCREYKHLAWKSPKKQHGEHVTDDIFDPLIYALRKLEIMT